MKYASFGSISTRTLRTEDLLATFADELEYHVQRNAEEWCSDDGRKERDRYLALVGEAREIDPEDDEADGLVIDLMDALTTFALPYGYFGSSEGDGADFGFWLGHGLEYDFDGLKVSDTNEVPEDYFGEVLHVNDHGNMTLYSADGGKLIEVWAVV